MRFSLVLSFVVLAPLPLVGCGTGRSELAGGDAGVDARSDDAGGCPSNVPTIACFGCDGNVVSLECVDGNWECPATPCPPPPPPIDDAGADACSSMPLLGCDVPEGCPENAAWPACIDGQWTCAFDGGGCWDAEPPPPPFDASDDANDFDVSPPPPPLFECGDIACDPATTYCQIDTGGAVDDAGGSQFSCRPLPASCGGTATCACAQSGPTLPPGACDCVEQGENVIVTCAVP